MNKVLFYRSIFGWFVLLERINYKTRTECRLRVWKPKKYKRPTRIIIPQMGMITAEELVGGID